MKEARSKLLILAGAILAYAFLLLPLLVVLGASLDDGAQAYFRFPPQAISLRWYVELSAKYWSSLMLSFGVAFCAGSAAIVVGMPAALGIARGSAQGSTVLETYFRFPLQVPFVVTGIVFLQFYYLLLDSYGIRLIGNFWGYVAAHTFFCIPYAAGAIGSAITGDLERVENAARIAGATEMRVFYRITLPALKPGVFAGFFFAFIVSFGDVPVSVFLTSGGIVPLPVEIFQTLQFDFDPRVLAISTIIVVLSSVFILAMQRIAGLDLVLAGSGNAR
jgi:putative spermidine/putrescine transport system permease protein